MEHGRGQFIAPDGTALDVPARHIGMVIAEPRKFGTTRNWVEGMYQQYDEPLYSEGRARREVLRRVLQKGWIRVREYVGAEGHWILEFEQWTPDVQRRARAWAVKLLAGRGGKSVRDRHADVRLVGLKGFQRTVQLSVLAKMSLDPES